jgi:hypothetical protein
MLRPSLAMLLAALVVVPACASATTLPDDARDALEAYWDSLPADPGIEHRIIRSWSGGVVDEPGPAPADLEVWCVEAEISSPGDPEVDGSRMEWIVTRRAGERTWSAALLASLSSTWPYQACGSDIPG